MIKDFYAYAEKAIVNAALDSNNNRNVAAMFALLNYIDELESKINELAGNVGTNMDEKCGDYPAPCNCDDLKTHNSHR